MEQGPPVQGQTTHGHSAHEVRYPPWLHHFLGVILGTLAVCFIALYVHEYVTDVRRDEQIKQLEANFAAFREPGKRYSASDGDRDRKTVYDLTKEFYAFRDLSRNFYTKAMQMNTELLLDCKLRQGQLESEVHYVMRTMQIEHKQ